MGKILLGLLLLTLSSSAYCVKCTSWEVEFAEISFFQDSMNPMTIHLICKVKSQMHCEYDSDFALIVWGDGYQSPIPLVDTVYLALGFDTLAPLKTYIGSHTYNSIYRDSTVAIGMQIIGVNDINNDNMVAAPAIHLCPISSINFSYLKNHLGFRPPSFPAFELPNAIRYHTFLYYPHIVYDTSYTLAVDNIWPISFYPDEPLEIVSITDYPQTSANIVTVDTANGNMNWTSPLGLGPSMVSYRVSLYKNGVFVCSMTRDFEVNVLDTFHLGINETNPSQPIRLYPNPNSGTFTLETSKQIGNEYIVYDMLGQIVQENVITADKQHIDMGAVAAGVYTLMLRGKTGAVRVVLR